MGTALMQIFLNRNLKGVEIGESNDAILKAMEEYSNFKIEDRDKYINKLFDILSECREFCKENGHFELAEKIDKHIN